jgi:hypothetical protein
LSTTTRAQKTESSAGRHGRAAASATSARALRALLLILVGLTVTMGSASSDAYLHRGTSQDNSIIYRQPTGRGLATNVDLRGLSDADLTSSVNLLSNAGYRFARQEFSWAQIEPAPGAFDWTQYHRIVDALSAAGIDVVVVLVDTPNWARAPEAVGFPDAPPLLTQKYQEMCTALRAEFPDLHLFQIGQNLDDPQYWGGKGLQVITYRSLLTAAARGLDIAATDSTLVTGEVGLNPDIRRAGGDIQVLERILRDPGIRGLIRVVGVAADGGTESPYDRSTATDTTNLSRVVLIRETIDDTGAVDMPVWLTHLGWTGSSKSPVSPENQGRYVESAIRRARSEWPWVGLMFNWSLGADPDSPGYAGLALTANGAPTPLYTAMAEYARSSFGSSITNGFVPPNVSACSYSGNWQDQHLTEGIYRTVRDPGALVTCRFWGTGISAFFRFSPDAGTASYAIDSRDTSDPTRGDGGSVILTYRVQDAFEAPVPLASGLPEGMHTVTIALDGSSGELVIGGFLVSRERPMIWPIAVLVAAGLVALFLGLRSIAFLAAEHVGLVEPRSDAPAPTPLPILPDWKPAPRFQR